MLLRRLARPLLATAFVYDGVDTLMNPEPRAKAAAALPESVASRLPADPDTVIKVNAVAQVSGGVLLALNKAPRLASIVLAASVLPSTVTQQNFWAEPDPDKKLAKRTAFLKDVSLLGGLLIAGADTEGKPSLGWRGKRAARSAAATVSAALPFGASASAGTGEALQHYAHDAAERAKELGTVAAAKGSELAETVQTHGPEWAAAAKERGAALVGVAKERAVPLAETARERTAPLALTARERGAEFAEVARHRGAELAEVARHRGAELADVAKERGAELGDRGKHRGAELGSLARHRGAGLAEVAKERGAELGDLAKHRGAELSDRARHRGAALADVAKERGAELGDRTKRRAGGTKRRGSLFGRG
ncbi:DoxX family protein [Nocardia higoensis]|uniref:DoxX family protein n=1 Tax=Nocardia higoensis TaxID=228599 RepID=A0ABS0DBS6_9NOCA|nr:DoxX family protein [Nocardia higoensis]MBF6355067.1 DoxX family protein [Nocardia higoensis]